MPFVVSGPVRVCHAEARSIYYEFMETIIRCFVPQHDTLLPGRLYLKRSNPILPISQFYFLCLSVCFCG